MPRPLNVDRILSQPLVCRLCKKTFERRDCGTATITQYSHRTWGHTACLKADKVKWANRNAWKLRARKTPKGKTDV